MFWVCCSNIGFIQQKILSNSLNCICQEHNMESLHDIINYNAIIALFGVYRVHHDQARRVGKVSHKIN